MRRAARRDQRRRRGAVATLDETLVLAIGGPVGEAYRPAPWEALLKSGAWLRNAEKANSMARLLEQELLKISGLKVLYPVQANAVFVQMPPRWVEALHRRGWHFYTIAGGERLMGSWDTQPQDIEAFLNDLRNVAAHA